MKHKFKNCTEYKYGQESLCSKRNDRRIRSNMAKRVFHVKSTTRSNDGILVVRSSTSIGVAFERGWLTRCRFTTDRGGGDAIERQIVVAECHHGSRFDADWWGDGDEGPVGHSTRDQR